LPPAGGGQKTTIRHLDSLPLTHYNRGVAIKRQDSMQRIRILSSGLLILTGVVHIIQISEGWSQPSVKIIVGFGVAYVLIGLLLVRRGRFALYLGVAIPALGLLLALAGLFISFTSVGIFFAAIDIVVIACCIWLMRHMKRK
jgi:hypothetical protein